MHTKLNQKIMDRLVELVERGEQLYLSDLEVFTNKKRSYQWGMSCLNILERVFGSDSTNYSKFNDIFAKIDTHFYFTQALGIMNASKDDFEHDMLFDTRILIEAEVFDDFLEQAEYLLGNNYKGPAAVVAGSVLEDGLRKLCLRNKIDLPTNPKLDRMNSDLAKQGVYNKLQQKQITVLADLRNKAAHGKWNEFGNSDVESMIKSVRDFMSKYFT